MADNSTTYQRLPGSGYRLTINIWLIVVLALFICVFAFLLLGRRATLWEGSDHLLLVESDGYLETYKRFYYRDIQSITAYKTKDGLGGNVALAMLASIMGVVVLGNLSDGSWAAFMVPFVIFAALLIMNVVLGPTCKCQLRTAVQVEDIPSLGRIKNVKK